MIIFFSLTNFGTICLPTEEDLMSRKHNRIFCLLFLIFLYFRKDVRFIDRKDRGFVTIGGSALGIWTRFCVNILDSYPRACLSLTPCLLFKFISDLGDLDFVGFPASVFS